MVVDEGVSIHDACTDLCTELHLRTGLATYYRTDVGLENADDPVDAAVGVCLVHDILLMVQNESEQFSATVNFSDCGINEGVASDFENIYVVPMYGRSKEINNNILPVPLLPLKELLLMGEYIHCEIDPTMSDSLAYKKIVITAQSRFNPDHEEDEYRYTGLKLNIYNVQT